MRGDPTGGPAHWVLGVEGQSGGQWSLGKAGLTPMPGQKARSMQVGGKWPEVCLEHIEFEVPRTCQSGGRCQVGHWVWESQVQERGVAWRCMFGRPTHVKGVGSLEETTSVMAPDASVSLPEPPFLPGSCPDVLTHEQGRPW